MPGQARSCPPESSTVEDEAREVERGPSDLIIAVGIDVLLDGLLIGVCFAASQRVGALLVAGYSP